MQLELALKGYLPRPFDPLVSKIVSNFKKLSGVLLDIHSGSLQVSITQRRVREFVCFRKINQANTIHTSISTYKYTEP